MERVKAEEMVSHILRCRPWIEAALEDGNFTHDFKDIVRGIAEGRYQFWPADRCCGITEVVVYPQTQVLHIFLAGGDMEQLHDMGPSVEEFARATGCSAITISGRRGWVRELRSRGYKELLTTVIKPLEPDDSGAYNSQQED